MSRSNLRIVLDTNILVRAVSNRSQTSVIFDALFNNDYVLCVSTEILLEYEEKLTQIYNQEVAELTIGALMLLPNVQRIEIYFDIRLITQDMDDDKFANCAFAANAHYLVSDDRHFRILKKIDFPKLEVIQFQDFKLLLKSKGFGTA
jgi:putative PIN family toxin of toxin-antitoxin system